MSHPILYLLAGSNGAGKTTLATRVLMPHRPGLTFVNADHIAAQRWPGAEAAHAYEASRAAAEQRETLLAARTSFITETVFSHPSKVGLVKQAADQGYLVHLHVVLIPEELAVARVSDRVRRGGHAVPEDKIRARYERLWALVAHAARLSDRARFYDNSSAARPYQVVADLTHGQATTPPRWPTWTPPALLSLTSGSR